MQVRHRNGPGNGYRSNAMGMRGAAAASRISPDSSMRGHQVYNSESRNYNRGGYSRGGSHTRQFQPPPPPPPPARENDIFVEAGRLAAAYLVSKGVLPPNALAGKWRNDGLRSQRADSQGFRPHGDVQAATGGRESAHSHLGNSSNDLGQGRRNFSHEGNSMIFRNSVRGRRSASFKHYEPEVSRQLARSGSWAEKSLVSPSMEGHLDTSACHHDEQPVLEDGNGERQTSSPVEKTREGDGATHLESGLKKCNSVDDEGVKESSSHGNNQTPDADEEIVKESDDADMFQAESVKEGQNNNHLEQNQEENKEASSSAREHTSDRMDDVDLSKHGKFEIVHTEASSEQDSIIVDKDNSARELSAGSGIHDVDVGNDISAANASSHQNKEFNETDVLDAPAKEKGEKRVLDDDSDCREGSKRPREWIPSINVQSDGCLPLSSSLENQPTLQDQRTSQSPNATLSPDQKSLNISLLPEDHAGSSEFMQEKQLFPGPFKTYDLNLNGASDVNESHPADSVLISQSFSDNGKEATPIDVDLCMSYNFNLPKTNSKHGIRDIGVEVIDLDNDSGQEDQIFSNPERRLVYVKSALAAFVYCCFRIS